MDGSETSDTWDSMIQRKKLSMRLAFALTASCSVVFDVICLFKAQRLVGVWGGVTQCCFSYHTFVYCSISELERLVTMKSSLLKAGGEREGGVKKVAHNRPREPGKEIMDSLLHRLQPFHEEARYI